MIPQAFHYDEGVVEILDQTLLPSQEVILTLRSTAELAEAISMLRVRGAPMLGIAGAYGVAQAARLTIGTREEIYAAAMAAGDLLAATRPTAVNLRWGVDRALRAASVAADVVAAVEAEARSIEAEDAAACEAIAAHAREFFRAGARVMTHCNTGALVTGGIGTALGAIRRAHEADGKITVIATETRPLLQGARLTAWELGRLGIEHAITPDGAAAGLIARGAVDVVIVGADRIAANGDTANKVGTYGLALAAHAAGVPFVVAAPTSTVDLDLESGVGIEIEMRPDVEVTHINGVAVAAAGSATRNPAFDVTPARLITAIVTERGVARPPFDVTLR